MQPHSLFTLTPLLKQVIRFATLLPILAMSGPASGSVDLHNHAFMKQGMQYGFTGDFDEPLRTSHYKDRFRSAVNRETLEHSDLELMVISLYAHPILGKRDLRQSIREQIERVRKWTAATQGSARPWTLARSAAQAREILAAGGHAVILSLEGADGILDTVEDLEEFIDGAGIRLVTLLHLIDDQYGGVAFLRGVRALASPIAFAREFLKGGFFGGVPLNSAGLSEKGAALATQLMKRGVWIDYAHASDASAQGLYPLSLKFKQPILNTHTTLRRYLGAERGVSDQQLQWIKESQGIIGLVPSEEFLEGTPNTQPDCHEGISRYVLQWKEVARRVGFERVFLGSDFNGGIPHLAPDCASPSSTSAGPARLFPTGMYRVDQLPALFQAIAAETSGSAALASPGPSNEKSLLARTQLETFLTAWAKVEKTPY
jgi:microsomal dipeptidase-like Zn-dependent dipeptidase